MKHETDMLKSLPSRALFRIWAETWNRLSHQWRDRSAPLHGWFVSPYPGQPFVHSIHVEAVVLSKSAKRCPYELVIGGTAVASGHTSEGTHRNDEDGWFQHTVSHTIGPKALRQMGSGLLRMVVSKDKRTSTLAVTPVRRRRTARVRQLRANYAEVWDGVSRSPREARISVAGYADDEEWRRSGRATADYVIASLAIGPGDHVLEIGCGTGRIGAHIAEVCGRWTGADVSRNMIRFAKRELRALGNVDFVELNGFDLDGVEDASYDAVYCSAVFMHLDEWDRYRYVQESFRVLEPGGRLFVDNYNLLGRLGWEFFGQNARLDIAVRPPHISRSSTPQELDWFLRQAGFEGVRTEPGEMFVTAIGTKPAASRYEMDAER